MSNARFHEGKTTVSIIDTLTQHRDVTISVARSPFGDLTQRQLGIFLLCATGSKQTVRGLAERLQVSRPVVSRAVSAMTERGLLSKVDDPGDGRSVLIDLTVPGAEFAKSVAQMVGTVYGQVH